MTKICDKSLFEPLIYLFKNSSQSSCYPDIWKRSSIIPTHKKSDNNTDQSLFSPPVVKYLTEIISNKIYNFLLEEGLLNPNQTGFRPGDSCVNHLLAVNHYNHS